jgi:hypothetical protein
MVMIAVHGDAMLGDDCDAWCADVMHAWCADRMHACCADAMQYVTHSATTAYVLSSDGLATIVPPWACSISTSAGLTPGLPSVARCIVCGIVGAFGVSNAGDKTYKTRNQRLIHWQN